MWLLAYKDARAITSNILRINGWVRVILGIFMLQINKHLVCLAILMGGVCSSAYAAGAKACDATVSASNQKQADPFQQEIRQAAKRYDINPALIKSVMMATDCPDPGRVAANGQSGLMQLMPATAKRFGATAIFDPAENIDAGARYIAYLMKRYEGSVAQVFTAYAADEGWEWEHETVITPFKDVRKPVGSMLDGLQKLGYYNKKANRQAHALLREWESSDPAYHAALQALPLSAEQKAEAAWLKARSAKVHYPRGKELRSCEGVSGKTIEALAVPYDGIIQKAAKRHGINPALLKSVIAAESCYREMVVSYKGASGLMQLMPATAEDLGVFDIFDPEENVNAGARYLASLLRSYNGSISHAVAAYNAGPGRIEKGVPITVSFTETRGYIRKVLTNLTKLEKGKKSVERARLLLADWEQAEKDYQAGLRGEVLAVVEPEAETDSTAAATLPQPNPPTPITVQDSTHLQEQPSQPVAVAAVSAPTQIFGEATPELKLASLRGESAVGTLQHAGFRPDVRLISAIDQGIVRVKSVSSVTIAPAVVTELPATKVAPAPEPAGLADCRTLPQALAAHTRPQGSGRYQAFFYHAQGGETLASIAARLGLSPIGIARLSNLPPDVQPNAGSRLKVAECARN